MRSQTRDVELLKEILRELRALRRRMEKKSPWTTWIEQSNEQHRLEGFRNGDEKHDWLLQQMTETGLSQQEVERTLLPLRKPLPKTKP
jgi:hypothetical protein